jgi:hypothetical protein
LAGLAATLASLPLLIQAGASANATFGSSDEPVAPPSPSECSGYLWTQDVTAKDAQVLSKSHPRIEIDGLTKPAGMVDVSEAITWDARAGGQQEDLQASAVDAQPASEVSQSGPELYEKMRVEFWKDGELIATTPYFTPDLPDDAQFAWVITPLGETGLGTDADAVYLAHSSQFMDTDGEENAFYPRSVCFNWRPFTEDPSAALRSDCQSATVTLRNDGELPADFVVRANDQETDVTVEARESIDQDIPLAEDTSTRITVLAGDETLLDQTIHTDCVPDATQPPAQNGVTIQTPTPPSTAPKVEVLAETAAQAEPQLAFTGSDTTRKTGIGVALLGLGLALMGIDRRRKRAEA